MNTACSSFTAACALTADAGGTAPGRIQLLPIGDFAARDGRPGSLNGASVSAWRLTPEGAAVVAARWRDRKTPLVVDYEHQTYLAEQNGRPAPAAGWIESLEVETSGLYATVIWTEAARAFIRADEYRYISPVFSFDPKTGDVLELKGAALTNNPALDGLEAVRAKTHEEDPPMKKETLDALRQFFALTDDADEAAVMAALKAQGGGQLTAMLAAAKADPDPAAFVPADLLTAEQGKTAKLTARIAELEKTGDTAALTAEIDAALADGRLPKSCEGWAKATAKANPEAIKSYIASAVPVAALKGTQTGGTPPAGAPVAALTDEDRYACKQLGLSEADFIAAKTKEGK